MTNKSGWHKLSDDERFARIQENRRNRLDRVDNMPAELRELVNSYGLAVVDTCMALGVTKARHIKHLVETVLDEFSPTRGSFSRQGVRTEVVTAGPLETALAQVQP